MTAAPQNAANNRWKMAPSLMRIERNRVCNDARFLAFRSCKSLGMDPVGTKVSSWPPSHVGNTKVFSCVMVWSVSRVCQSMSGSGLFGIARSLTWRYPDLVALLHHVGAIASFQGHVAFQNESGDKRQR